MGDVLIDDIKTFSECVMF